MVSEPGHRHERQGNVGRNEIVAAVESRADLESFRRGRATDQLHDDSEFVERLSALVAASIFGKRMA